MNDINRTRIKYVVFPIIALLIIIATSIPLYLFFHFNYRVYIPIIVFMSGIIIMFIGAWWDFGAKKFISDVFKTHMELNEDDLEYVYKQQFIMMLIYIGIGFLYFLIAFIIYLVLPLL